MVENVKQDGILSDGDEDMIYLLKRRRQELNALEKPALPKKPVPAPRSLEKQPRSRSSSMSQSSKKSKKSKKSKSKKKDKKKKKHRSKSGRASAVVEDLTSANPLLEGKDMQEGSQVETRK